MFKSMFPMNENWFKVSKKEKDTSPILECCRGIFLVNFDFFPDRTGASLQREKKIFHSYTNIHKQTQFKWVPITFSE